MRDHRRIDRILTLLHKIWEHQPDVRFNQLISNLQFLYSQENNNMGRRQVYRKENVNFEETSYLDLFYLEDDKWEEFLIHYWTTIEKEIQKQMEEITQEVVDVIIELLIEAGIEKVNLSEPFQEKSKHFWVKENKWLTIDAITKLIKNFSFEDRKELFEKINKYY